MIEIKVSQQDMAHIICRKAELFNLSDRCVLAIKLDVIEMDKKWAEPGIRRLDIAQTKASIDENKSLIRFNQETMADEASCQTTAEAIEERPTNRTHTATIEMMNVHKGLISTTFSILALIIF